MAHSLITLAQLGLTFPHKTCFTGFSTQIPYGARIAVTGRNGSGKSTLLQILQGIKEPSEGKVSFPQGTIYGYVPQIIEDSVHLSGGQRLNEALTQALVINPDILIMDEPTNHLDIKNRHSLMRLLNRFRGTLVIASHDVELLETCIDITWHIEEGKITVFSGKYTDYVEEKRQQRTSVEHELHHLAQEKKETHKALMKEQGRAKNSRLRGEKHMDQRKWPTIVSKTKSLRAEETSGRKKNDIRHKKQELLHKLAEKSLPEIIMPRFSLATSRVNPSKNIVAISEGSCGYDHPILKNIYLSLGTGDRLAVTGNNGSGKSTLVKAILHDPSITKTGVWTVPPLKDIGYMDQHYATLDSKETVSSTIQAAAPQWSHAEVRRHLNDFLFRKNEEVEASITTLSGGEKARLSFARIAAHPPRLLILDEITNNLDSETRQHVSQILKPYPGTMIVISHDQVLLKEIGIENYYNLSDERCEK